MFNVREQVTNRIIEALENGTPPWRQGWASMEPHYNLSSSKPYAGINQLLLGMSGFSDPRWVTMRQANAMRSEEHPQGLRVRKGEKATMIVRMVEVAKGDGDKAPVDGEVLAEDKNTRLVMKAFHVFNASQIDGMPPLPQTTRDVPPVEAVERALEGLKGDGMVLLYGGDSAHYIPKADSLRMPDKGRFRGDAAYELATTALHEAMHASGHKKRLDRFGLFEKLSTVEARAREELVAELGSVFYAAEIGLPVGLAAGGDIAGTHLENHAAYIGSWLEALKKDKGEIFKAAAKAQKACDWLREHAVVPVVAAAANAGATPVEVPMNEVPVEATAKRKRVGMRM